MHHPLSRVLLFFALVGTAWTQDLSLLGVTSSGRQATPRAPAAPTHAPKSGHLVIIGGSLHRVPSDPVFARLLSRAGGGSVGILAIASSLAAQAGPQLARVFGAYTGRPTSWLEPELASHRRPEDRALARRIREMQLLYFSGGDQGRILAQFRPGRSSTQSYDALRKVLAAGGTVAGSSAGAAMMSDPMIRGGTSQQAMTSGLRATGMQPGMGLFPYGVVDQHFLRRGRLARLVAALQNSSTRLGFGVDEGRGIDVDLGTHRIEALGSHALLVVDARTARFSPGACVGLQVSLLGSGDVVNGKTLAVSPARGATAVTSRGPSGRTLAPWAPYAVYRLIQALPGGGVQVASDGTGVLRVSAPPSARFWTRGGYLSATGIRMDLYPRR
jgi:cyanophycinase